MLDISISCKREFLDQLSIFRSVLSVIFCDQLSVLRSVVRVTFSISCLFFDQVSISRSVVSVTFRSVVISGYM